MKYQGLLVTDLSGRAGGVVAARNKGGGYLRAFVTPTQPNTVIQSWARARFAGAQSAWHGLTDSQKNAWNMFAITDYKPQRGAIPGVTYTGAQAFTGLRMTALGCEDYRDATGSISTPAVTATYGSFNAPTSAPATQFGGVPVIGSTPAVMTMKSCTFSASSGAVNATIEFDGGITVATAPTFEDYASSQGIGFAFYASLPGVQAQSFKPNPGFTLISALGKPSISSGWISGTSMVVTATAPTSIGIRHKLWYTAGDVVKITAFAVSVTTGQAVSIGSYDTTVL